MRGSICWCVRGLAVPCNTTHFSAGVMPCVVTTRPAPVRAFCGGLRSIASCYRRRVWRFSQHFPLICLTREGGSTAPWHGGSWWPFHLSMLGSNAAVAAFTCSTGSVGGETNLRKNCINDEKKRTGASAAPGAGSIGDAEWPCQCIALGRAGSDCRRPSVAWGHPCGCRYERCKTAWATGGP